MGAIDVNLLKIFGNTQRQAYQTPVFTRGDVRRLEFLFFDDEGVLPLSREDQAKAFLLGPANQMLASAVGGPDGVGDTASYIFDLALTTQAISDLFSNATTTTVAVRLVVVFSLAGRHCTTDPIATELRRNYVTVWDNPPPGPPDLSGRATAAQALEGADNNTWMTPLRTKEAFTALSGNVSLNYNPSASDTVQSVEVGGADPLAASGWRVLNLSQALDRILFPTLLPTISTPKSATLTVSGASGVQEVGSPVARVLTAVFARGRITNGNGSLGPELVGAATNYTYSGPGLTTTTITSPTQSVSTDVVPGNNQWTVSVAHAAGSGAYADNKGNNSTALDGSRGQGTASASTAGFLGVYPWYRLESPVFFTAEQFAAAIEAGNASAIHASAVLTKYVADAAGTIAVPYNLSGKFLGVAYEASLTTKTRYYVDALDNGNIGLVFSAAQSLADVATTLWERDYTVHISKNTLTNSNVTIELRTI
jgi:hypothetical protein